MGNISDVKVSVVVPTYNVEPYFRECLNSLAAQTLSNIEFIIINDGSPDNCGAIADEYAAKDDRFRVIHKENGGYGTAVNLGFEQAKGEYVGIVEPDDWIEPDMYEKLYTQAKRLDADVCKCGFYNFNSHKKGDNRDVEGVSTLCRVGNLTHDRVFVIVDHPEIMQLHASIWTNLYRQEFLIENNIKINSSPAASYQDLPFMVEVMCKAKRIAAIPDIMYHWRVEPNQNSSTRAKGAKLMIMADQCIESTRIVKECGLFDQLKEYLGSQIFNCCYGFYMQIDRRYKDEFRKRIKLVFRPFYDDATYNYKYLSEVNVSYIKDYIMNDKNICKWSIAVFRRKFIQLHLNRNSRRLVLFGIEIFNNNR